MVPFPNPWVSSRVPPEAGLRFRFHGYGMIRWKVWLGTPVVEKTSFDNIWADISCLASSQVLPEAAYKSLVKEWAADVEVCRCSIFYGSLSCHCHLEGGVVGVGTDDGFHKSVNGALVSPFALFFLG